MSPEAVPTLNLAKKLFESDKQPRRIIQRHETEKRGETQSKARVYKHLDDFKSAIACVKLSGRSRKETKESFTLEYFDSEHAVPLYSVRVDSGLGFSVAVFGWFLPDTHELYYEHKCSLFHITASSLCKAIQAFSVCPGLPEIFDAVDPIDGVLLDILYLLRQNCIVTMGPHSK